MPEKIQKEKNSADHLLYVSLKYTKTCDVIQNLIERWIVMIEQCFDAVLKRLQRLKKISSIPIAPKAKAELIIEKLGNQPEVKDIIPLYLFFKRVKNLEKIREGEFRKNVALKVLDKGEWITIDIEKLKQWNERLERFLSWVFHYIK